MESANLKTKNKPKQVHIKTYFIDDLFKSVAGKVKFSTYNDISESIYNPIDYVLYRNLYFSLSNQVMKDILNE